MKKLLILFFAALTSVHAEDIVFPPDAVADVTKAPYNAKADGMTDDTDAIQKALDEGQHIVYLPNGTYLVSKALRWGKNQRHTVLQGQSRDSVTIRLKDECPGFDLADKPLPVIWTGKPSSLQRVGNGIRNVTVDTGRGNPGAIGIQFVTSIQGTIDTVRIRCGESGPIGLDLGYGTQEGPCLISHLEVIGFDRGIFTAGTVDGVTFEDIHLEAQKTSGIHNEGQSIYLRRLDSVGSVTAIHNGGKEGFAVLVDAHIVGTGSSQDADAVFNGEKDAMYVRNLQTQGFRSAIRNDGGHQQRPDGAQIPEWFSHPPIPLFSAEPRSIGIPIRDLPEVPLDPVDDWVSVAKFQPKKGMYQPLKGKPSKVDDWTDAIQQAIDSGKSTIYFPKEGLQFCGTVHVRGKAHRFVGCEQPWGHRCQGTWAIEDGNGPVVFERFDWSNTQVVIQQNSKRPLIVREVSGGNLQVGKDAGDTFLSDVSAQKIRIAAGSSVWARQLNMNDKTATESKIVNDGGNLWILGLKAIGDSTQIESLNGAHTQVDGCLVQSNSNKPKATAFIVHDSSFSIAMAESALHRTPYSELVTETRGQETKTLKNGDVPSRAGGSLLTLFSTSPATTK